MKSRIRFARFRKALLILLVLFLLALGYSAAKPGAGANRVFPSAPYNTMGMAIAISESHYGLSGFKGYMKVMRYFTDYIGYTSHDGACRYGTCTYAQITQAIRNAMSLKDVASDGFNYSFGANAGGTVLYKLAFNIFGFNAEAIFYLIYSLLALSVLSFLLAFHSDTLALFLAVIFMCGYLVVALCAPSATIDLQSVFNDRFMPVYTILPAFHLILTSARGGPLTSVSVLTAAVQAAIMQLSISARTAGLSEMIAVLAFFILGTAARLASWTFGRFRPAPQRPRLAPILILLIAGLALTGWFRRSMDPMYEKVGERASHGFGHDVFLGLAALPTMERKYGFHHNEDIYVFKQMEARAPRYGYSFSLQKHVFDHYGWYMVGDYPRDKKEIMIQGGRYSRIVWDMYLEILRDDPLLVAESYLCKLPLFLDVFFSTRGEEHFHLDAPKFLLYFPIPLCILLAAIGAWDELYPRWLKYQCLIIFLFLFSLMAPIVVIPEAMYIADSGLLFSMLLYSSLVSGAILIVNGRGTLTAMSRTAWNVLKKPVCPKSH